MNLSKLLIGSLIIGQLLSSCTTLYISEISRTPNFTFNLNDSKSVLVVGNNDVSLNEFIKTFNKKYKDKREFVDDYKQSFSEKLRNGSIFTRVGMDKSSQWDSTKLFTFSQDQSKIVDSLILNSHVDYLLNISNLDISSRYQTVTSGGGLDVPMTTITTEICVVKSRIQIMDIKTRQIVLEFVSTGEGSVFLFAYVSALDGAISRSIDYAIEYLKTGKTKF